MITEERTENDHCATCGKKLPLITDNVSRNGRTIRGKCLWCKLPMAKRICEQ